MKKVKLSFTLARRHDDLNTTLSGNSVPITNQNDVVIKSKTTTIFTGKIDSINATYAQRNEQLVISCLSLSEAVCIIQ